MKTKRKKKRKKRRKEKKRREKCFARKRSLALPHRAKALPLGHVEHTRTFGRNFIIKPFEPY